MSGCRIRALPIDIVTVHDPRFLRMQLARTPARSAGSVGAKEARARKRSVGAPRADPGPPREFDV
jgi:hypothetical protein